MQHSNSRTTAIRDYQKLLQKIRKENEVHSSAMEHSAYIKKPEAGLQVQMHENNKTMIQNPNRFESIIPKLKGLISESSSNAPNRLASESYQNEHHRLKVEGSSHKERKPMMARRGGGSGHRAKPRSTYEACKAFNPSINGRPENGHASEPATASVEDTRPECIPKIEQIPQCIGGVRSASRYQLRSSSRRLPGCEDGAISSTATAPTVRGSPVQEEIIWKKEARVLVQEVRFDDTSHIQLDCYPPTSTNTPSAAKEATDGDITYAYIKYMGQGSQKHLRVIIQKDDYEERKGLVKNCSNWPMIVKKVHQTLQGEPAEDSAEPASKRLRT